ncbi:MAG: hypothetical protein WEA31_01070 [Pirellulales bacterium]
MPNDGNPLSSLKDQSRNGTTKDTKIAKKEQRRKWIVAGNRLQALSPTPSRLPLFPTTVSQVYRE